MITNPHHGQPIRTAATPLNKATGAMILLHGRGASAHDILALGQALAPEGWALLAPEAAGHTWYPYSFLSPREQNEPFLSSALAMVQEALQLALADGLPTSRIVIAGFSQGACLATEFVARNPHRYAALLAFTGGLIGPQAPLTLEGDLAGTPVLLTSGDPDPHVPWERVERSGDLLKSIGAQVTLHRHPGRPHTVSAIEIEAARQLIALI